HSCAFVWDRRRSTPAPTERPRMAPPTPAARTPTNLGPAGAPRLASFPRVIVAGEVAEALRERRGVVALESTLIAHGLPAPDNLRVAREAEAAVRAAGAVPATIAVVGGVVRIGLDDDALAAVALGEGVVTTGGLGGVHRGARESWDESADLTTLARTAIVVVSAGVKSILDVAATLER